MVTGLQYIQYHIHSLWRPTNSFRNC